MKAKDVLRTLESQDRVYSSNGWYQHYVGPCYEWIQGHDSEKEYFKHQELPRLEEDAFSYRDQTLVRSLIQWGGQDSSEIESHFGVKLPPWVHDFYSEVTRAVVYLRNPIMILSPGEVIEFEELRRDAFDKAFKQKLPIRQIGFAHAGIHGGSFAFRLNHRKGVWQISYSSLDDTLDEEQSERHEDYAKYDDNFDDWLTRLFETDGYPLARERTYEVCHTDRER